MKARLGRVSALAALCACTGAAFAASVPVASAAGTKTCSTITGAGSSLQTVAQEEVWIKGAEAFGAAGNRWEAGECKADPSITYFPTSSGKGLAQWGANATEELKEENPPVTKFPAYIGTDVGPEGPATTAGTQMHEMDKAGKNATTANEVVTTPVAQSAIAIVVSLPESCSATVGNTPKVKSKLLNEEWTKDEIKLETLVSGAGIVCAKVPHLYARESPSGTTAGFKRWNYDIAVAEPWTKLAGPSASAVEAESTNWPSGAGGLPAGQPETAGFSKGIQLAEGVIEKPGTTGAVGYADLADAIKAKFTTKVAAHTNGKGEKYDVFMVEVQRNEASEAKEVAKYASSEGTTGGSNCGNAEYGAPATVGPNVDWSKARQNNVQTTTTYPICTLTFDVAWHMYEWPVLPNAAKKYEMGEYNSALSYLEYVVNSKKAANGGGQNEELVKHHYGKLTKPELEEAQSGINGTNVAY
jgi:hypothetical protein